VDELESLAILPKRYIIVELSNDLRIRQQQYIKENLSNLYDRFIWLDKLPAEKIKAIVFDNELLDAMPVDIFRYENNKLIQQGFIRKGDTF
ncbi:SAM-dependent methyltransferase, partial [Francisella tularensis subsp. holarctica]|uniref:SAM-dependent methyltransferase n=1 Tax=Francisella tularensis TaxID=263 RepID=UPI002381A127